MRGVETQLTIRSPVTTAELVNQLEVAGAHILAIHVESPGDVHAPGT